ncbi:MAG: DNA/RNA nuclease SfsA [Bacteroidetes bacterium]|nr:DNA/RNA nuclease SfsA [Bacteroidota bacterium]
MLKKKYKYQFDQPLIAGRLIRRYKRFLADIELDTGNIVTAHCTNSGSMKSCIEEDAPVYVSFSDRAGRRTRYTWEMIFINNGWIGVNTMIPNQIAFSAIKQGFITELIGYPHIQREVKYNDSRLDIYAENQLERCFIEVKNVTLKENEYSLFPDSVSTRGKKHLEALIKAKEEGYRAVMLYVVQRTDVEYFSPAFKIDPNYAAVFEQALSRGVEVIVYQFEVTPISINLIKKLPLKILKNTR